MDQPEVPGYGNGLDVTLQYRLLGYVGLQLAPLYHSNHMTKASGARQGFFFNHAFFMTGVEGQQQPTGPGPVVVEDSGHPSLRSVNFKSHPRVWACPAADLHPLQVTLEPRP